MNQQTQEHARQPARERRDSIPTDRANAESARGRAGTSGGRSSWPEAARDIGRRAKRASRAAAWLAVACLGSAGIHGASAQSREVPIRRVRSMHRTIRAALQEGYHRSPTLRHVLLRLDESTVVVYVVSGFCEVTRLDGCLLGHVTIAGNTRYLRIVVNPHKPATELIARIGHELQHALEVAAAPEVVDAASMLALFKRIASGPCRGVLVDCYETRAAVEVEDRVLKELNRGGSW